MVKSVFDKFYESTGEKIQFNAYLRLELMKSETNRHIKRYGRRRSDRN